MQKNMILHDTRLKGAAPSNRATNIFKVNESHDIAQIFHWIGTFARSEGGLDNLFIMCHGGVKSIGINDDIGLKSINHNVIRGLQIGEQNLLLSNLNVTATLHGYVKKITIYACNIAERAPGEQYSAADGKLFCKNLAGYTNAEVIASSAEQKYNRGMMNYCFGTEGTIDFGSWEGPVFSFSPNGKENQIIK